MSESKLLATRWKPLTNHVLCWVVKSMVKKYRMEQPKAKRIPLSRGTVSKWALKYWKLGYLVQDMFRKYFWHFNLLVLNTRYGPWHAWGGQWRVSHQYRMDICIANWLLEPLHYGLPPQSGRPPDKLVVTMSTNTRGFWFPRRQQIYMRCWNKGVLFGCISPMS